MKNNRFKNTMLALLTTLMLVMSAGVGAADGSGELGRVAYEVSSGLTAGVNISYDEAFDTRVSADIKVRFAGPITTAAKKKKWENPTINALLVSPKNIDVRVHDKCPPGMVWDGRPRCLCTDFDLCSLPLSAMSDPRPK